MAVSVVRALPSTLLPTTINVLCTILKNSTTLVLTRCPWTWPTSFKAWKPSKDWSRFEPPTLFGWEFHRSTNLHQSIYPYWKKVSQILTVTLVRISKRLKKKTMKSRFLKTENWKNTKVSWINEARILTDLWKLDCKYPNEKILHYPVEIFLSDRRTL